MAAHYGVEWDGTTEEDAKVGLRMACPYHGGSNPTSLHIWLGEKDVTTKKGKVKTVPILYARCHSRRVSGAGGAAFRGPRSRDCLAHPHWVGTGQPVPRTP